MRVLAEKEAEDLLRQFVPVAESSLVDNLDGALTAAAEVGFPCVLKLVSREALHKTDIGGVKVVRSDTQLEDAYGELQQVARREKIQHDGVLVQEYVEGTEVIMGLKRDKTFGHAVMFGLGGILVEITRDVSFRVCPVTEEDAQEMIDELKFRDVLYGYRGRKPVNSELLKDAIVQVSKLPEEFPGIEELDINPFMINDETGKVVDARISMS